MLWTCEDNSYRGGAGVLQIGTSLVQVAPPVCCLLLNQIVAALGLLDARARWNALARSLSARARARGAHCVLGPGTLGLVLPMLAEPCDHLLHLREVVLSEHVFLPDPLFLYTFVSAVSVEQVLQR